MVNSTWTAPGGATLRGSNPSWTGSSYQSTLMLTSLGTGDAGNYICGVSVTPMTSQYITGPMGRNVSILGRYKIYFVLLLSLYILPSVSVHTVKITTSGSPVAGQMYTLICNGTLVGSTSLTPVVTWRNSTGVVTSGNSIIVSNGNLKFNPLHTSIGGQYTCQSTVNYLPSSTTTALMSIFVQSMYM